MKHVALLIIAATLPLSVTAITIIDSLPPGLYQHLSNQMTGNVVTKFCRIAIGDNDMVVSVSQVMSDTLALPCLRIIVSDTDTLYPDTRPARRDVGTHCPQQLRMAALLVSDTGIVTERYTLAEHSGLLVPQLLRAKLVRQLRTDTSSR